MQPILSIVIVTYNSIDHIDACLSALLQADSSRAIEVIVVDNASQDDTPARIRSCFPSVRLLAEQENRGFAGAVNHGIAVAEGTLIALLNPDAVPRKVWIDQLATSLEQRDVGVAGSKVIGLDGRIQSVGAVLDPLFMLPAYRGEGEIDTGQYDVPADVWSVHGAAMAFPRRIWSELGGFDEGYFPLYLEESDFCERVRRAGYRVITAPQAVVEHAESASTGKYSAQFYFYFLRNRLRYMAKWLDKGALWSEFRQAEHRRLRTAPMLDRRVARLVYEQGIPPFVPPDALAREKILMMGQSLREGVGLQDGLDGLLLLLQGAQANSLHREVVFHSRLPLVARLRTLWNNVATRWYVRPNLDQQTRFNLALERACTELVQQTAARAAADALDIALLAWSRGYGAGDSDYRSRH